MRLENKVALITGGYGGMGRASARLFAGEGATVVITGRSEDEVDAAVTAWTSQLDKDEAFRLLQQADIPSAPVRSLSEVLHDPVLRDRGMLAEIGAGDRAGTVLGSPLHLAAPPVPPTWPAPLLGEHTAEVLRDRLNLPDEDINQLTADEVI